MKQFLFKGSGAWAGCFADSKLNISVMKDLKYFCFLHTRWRIMASLIYNCTFEEYAYILSAYEENTHISFRRIRKICLYPFCVYGEYAHILSGAKKTENIFLWPCLRIYFGTTIPTLPFYIFSKTSKPLTPFYSIRGLFSKDLIMELLIITIMHSFCLLRWSKKRELGEKNCATIPLWYTR